MGVVTVVNHNKILKDTLRRFVETVSNLLSEKMSKGDDPVQILAMLMYTFPFNNQEVGQQYLINHLPEAQDYDEAISSHPILGKQVDVLVGTNMGASAVTPLMVMQQFMKSLLDKQKGVIFNPKAFDSIFNEMMDFFKSDHLQMKMISPLEHFELDTDLMLLPNDWRIEKIPTDIKVDWVRRREYSFGDSHYLWADYALRKDYKSRKVIVGPKSKDEDDEEIDPQEWNKARDELETTMSALRILKSGGVVNRLYELRVLGWHVGGPLGSSSNPFIPEVGTGPTYKLAKEEKLELTQIIEALSRLKSEKALQVAVRRLNYACIRGDIRPEDKILDCMIGFESLFLGPSSELGYRLSLRAAILLAESVVERRQIQSEMYLYYRLRSNIIHGYNERAIESLLRKSETDLDQVASRLQNLLRESIKKFICAFEEAKDHPTIIKEIDQRILAGSNRMPTTPAALPIHRYQRVVAYRSLELAPQLAPIQGSQR
jgi:hypothetical protein